MKMAKLAVWLAAAALTIVLAVLTLFVWKQGFWGGVAYIMLQEQVDGYLL